MPDALTRPTGWIDPEPKMRNSPGGVCLPASGPFTRVPSVVPAIAERRLRVSRRSSQGTDCLSSHLMFRPRSRRRGTAIIGSTERGIPACPGDYIRAILAEYYARTDKGGREFIAEVPTTIPRSKTVQLKVDRRSWHGDACTAGGKRPDFHALVAEDEIGRRRDLVANYPREMLLALARELSSRWKALPVGPDLLEIGAGKLAVGEDSEIPADIRERLDPPPWDAVDFDSRADPLPTTSHARLDCLRLPAQH
jgi:hypothetical protein